MANKLDRIEKDIEKTKAKIAELQKQLREAGGICGVPARRRFAERPGPAAGF